MNKDAKERLREYVENDDIYSEYKNGKCDMSDFDKFCIEHCKDIECLLNEVQEYKDVIDKAIEIIKDNIPKEYIRSCDTADGIGRYELDTDTWQYKVYEMLKEVGNEKL